MENFFRRGGLWVLGQGVIFCLLILSGLVWRMQWESWATTVVAVVLFTIGGVFGIAGAIALGKNLTPLPSPSPGAQLVRCGIYSYVRHPLYTAVICACFGWALVMASWPAAVCAFGAAYFLDRKARVEERALQLQFPDYPDFARHVRRFIPFIY